MIDLHAHILPGFDDGARSLEEARELARGSAAEGVVAVAATPHVRSDYPTTAERMEHGVAQLQLDFEREGIPLRILHGGEISLDRLWELSEDELRRFSIGQTGRYVLLECPYRGWPPALDGAVKTLADAGMTVVLAHPERNPDAQERPALVESLVAAGALVQVTAASLTGSLGSAAAKTASALLELGIVHVLATDAHGPHIQRGGLADAARALGDPARARYLTQEAPAAIVSGAELPDPPSPEAPA